MKVRVRLDTLTDIQNFVNVAAGVKESVVLRDNIGNQVSAKSLLGAIYTMEWDEIYCYCEKDISASILSFII